MERHVVTMPSVIDPCTHPEEEPRIVELHISVVAVQQLGHLTRRSCHRNRSLRQRKRCSAKSFWTASSGDARGSFVDLLANDSETKVKGPNDFFLLTTFCARLHVRSTGYY